MNPFLGSVFLLMVLLILFPVAISVIKWARKNWFDNVMHEPPVLFAAGIDKLEYFPAHVMEFDRGFPCTRYLLCEFQFFMLHYLVHSFLEYFVLFIICLPEYQDIAVNIIYARIHFWISYWGLCYLFWKTHIDQTIPFQEEGFQPRRYVEYSGWADYKYLQESNRHLLIAVILVLAAQVLFLFNFIYSLLKARSEKR